jgi:branched-chain amino acid transport system substrate-binding protein
VGGLFIPAGADDVVMLAPQVFFHKIRTQMLGCTGWHNEKTVNDGKRYVNNAIIATNLQTGQDSAGWQAFRALYKARFSADPDRVAAMGYDAAELLLRALQQAKWETDVKRVCAALLSINGYEGVSGRISFDPVTGANTEAAIVKIADKQFVRIQ